MKIYIMSSGGELIFACRSLPDAIRDCYTLYRQDCEFSEFDWRLEMVDDADLRITAVHRDSGDTFVIDEMTIRE